MTKKPLNRVPASPVRPCAATLSETAGEMCRLLDLKFDGTAFHGTCPSCCCKGALFVRDGADGPQLSCLEGCTGKQIGAAMVPTGFEGLPPDFERPRPYDTKRLPSTSPPGSDERH